MDDWYALAGGIAARGFGVGVEFGPASAWRQNAYMF